jgi:hypothetical protein
LTAEINLGANDNGIAGHPNILRGQAGETIIIDGQDTVSHIIKASGSSYWRITNLTIQDGKDSAFGAQSSTTNTDITLDHLTITRNVGTSVDYKGFDISTNAGQIMTNLLIEDISITNLLSTGFWLADCNNLIIRRVNITNCGTAGLVHCAVYLDDGTLNFLIEDVIVTNFTSSSPAFKCAISDAATVAGTFNRCQAINTGTGGFEMIGAATDTFYMTNCYVYSDGGMTNAFRFSTNSNEYVYNCTVVGSFIASVFRMDEAGTRTVVMKNNIFSGTAGFVIRSAAATCTLTSDYNCFIGGGHFAYMDAANHTWAEWIAAPHSYDEHSLTWGTDPLLASTYILSANSPCINTGATLADVTTDIRGVVRPQGAAYDIGAYEFISATMQGCVLSGGVLH